MTAIPLRPQCAQTKHTYDCLAQRLMELAPVLYSCFPAYAADCGLDAPLSVMETDADREPEAAGANVTFTTQDAETARLAGQLLV